MCWKSLTFEQNFNTCTHQQSRPASCKNKLFLPLEEEGGVKYVIFCVQAVADKNASIAESERCQRKLGLANRLINALASEGARWVETVKQYRLDYQVQHCYQHASFASLIYPILYKPFYVS